MKLYKLLPTLLLASLAGGAIAKPLSLTDAVATALAHNPEVTAADRDVAVTQTKLEQVRAAGRPKVNLTMSLIDLSEVPVMKMNPVALPSPPFPAGTAIALPNMPLASSSISTGAVQAEVPIYTGGRVKYAEAQVQEAIAAQQARAAAKRNEVAYAVTRAYLSAVLAQRVANVTEQAYTTMHLHFENAQKMLAQGVIPKYEVIRAETEVANQDRRRLDAHNQAELALAYLQDVMGVPKDETPELTTSLAGNADFSLSLEDAIIEATAASNDMQALAARNRMYEAGKKAARAENNPVIAAIASHELYINEQPFTTPSDTVGLVASAPLYDGGLTEARVAEQTALQARNQSDIERLTNGIRLEVRKYYLDLESARKALEATDKAVELATESRRLALRRFEEGQGTGVEVSDAILALSIAETNREQARYQYDISYYGLLKAMGRMSTVQSTTGGTTDETN